MSFRWGLGDKFPSKVIDIKIEYVKIQIPAVTGVVKQILMPDDWPLNKSSKKSAKGFLNGLILSSKKSKHAVKKTCLTTNGDVLVLNTVNHVWFTNLRGRYIYPGLINGNIAR